MEDKPQDAAVLVMAGPDDEVDPAFSQRMRAESAEQKGDLLAGNADGRSEMGGVAGGGGVRAAVAPRELWPGGGGGDGLRHAGA